MILNNALTAAALLLLLWKKKEEPKTAPALATRRRQSFADAIVTELPLLPPPVTPDPYQPIFRAPPGTIFATQPGPSEPPVIFHEPTYKAPTPKTKPGPYLPPVTYEPPPPPPPPVSEDILTDNRVIMSDGRSERFRYVWLEGSFTPLERLVLWDSLRKNFFIYIIKTGEFALVFMKAGLLDGFRLASNLGRYEPIQYAHSTDELAWFERYSFWYLADDPGIDDRYKSFRNSLRFWAIDFPGRAPIPLDALTIFANRYRYEP